VRIKTKKKVGLERTITRTRDRSRQKTKRGGKGEKGGKMAREFEWAVEQSGPSTTPPTNTKETHTSTTPTNKGEVGPQISP